MKLGANMTGEPEVYFRIIRHLVLIFAIFMIENCKTFFGSGFSGLGIAL